MARGHRYSKHFAAVTARAADAVRALMDFMSAQVPLIVAQGARMAYECLTKIYREG